MDIHKNARPTPRGREHMVNMVLGGQGAGRRNRRLAGKQAGNRNRLGGAFSRVMASKRQACATADLAIAH